MQIFDPSVDVSHRPDRARHWIQKVELEVAGLVTVGQECDVLSIGRELWKAIVMGPEGQDARLTAVQVDVADACWCRAIEVVNNETGEHGLFTIGRSVNVDQVADLPGARPAYGGVEVVRLLVGRRVPKVLPACSQLARAH